MTASPSVGRWQDYVLERGLRLTTFLHEHLCTGEHHVLFLIGKGFDPRMCLGLEALVHAGGGGRRHVIGLSLDGGGSSPSPHTERANGNWKHAQALIADLGKRGPATVEVRTIRMLSEEGRRIGPREATNLFENSADLAPFTDIIVDISALPLGVYFPLLAKILYLLDHTEFSEPSCRRNLFVFVAENPELDSCIQDLGVDERADYLYPFRQGIDMEATAEVPRVWMPLLGEKQEVQLERHHSLVDPAEISPVLPSPSRNPRRGDDLVLEYRDLLLDRLRVEPHNIIYASEHNPFEVYRQLRKTILSYGKVLQPLQGCKAILSSLSSKLMSIGAFLVAYEFMDTTTVVGVAHVEARDYTLCDAPDALSETSELFGLWLAGECYVP